MDSGESAAAPRARRIGREIEDDAGNLSDDPEFADQWLQSKKQPQSLDESLPR